MVRKNGAVIRGLGGVRSVGGGGWERGLTVNWVAGQKRVVSEVGCHLGGGTYFRLYQSSTWFSVFFRDVIDNPLDLVDALGYFSWDGAVSEE